MGKHKKHKKKKWKNDIVRRLPPATKEEQAVFAAYVIWWIGEATDELVIPEKLVRTYFGIDGSITLKEKKGRMLIGFDTLDVCPLADFDQEFQSKLAGLLKEAINNSEI